MKRFHVHIAVEDLPASIHFYSQLFGSAPATEQVDYAKWMLDEPRVNFAISVRDPGRGHGTGVNHFGFQAETPEELAELKTRAEAASDASVLDEGITTCCYSNSEKHWTTDPQGLAWEHFLSMSDALTFGEDVAARDGACCIPLKGEPVSTDTSDGPCCIPGSSTNATGCCG